MLPILLAVSLGAAAPFRFFQGKFFLGEVPDKSQFTEPWKWVYKAIIPYQD